MRPEKALRRWLIMRSLLGNQELCGRGAIAVLLSHGAILGLLLGIIIRLLLYQRAQRLDRPFEFGVGKVRVDFSRSDVFMPEGALNEPYITRSLIKPGREGVAECVDSASANDPSFSQPIVETQLNLPCAAPRTADSSRLTRTARHKNGTRAKRETNQYSGCKLAIEINSAEVPAQRKLSQKRALTPLFTPIVSTILLR